MKAAFFVIFFVAEKTFVVQDHVKNCRSQWHVLCCNVCKNVSSQRLQLIFFRQTFCHSPSAVTLFLREKKG